ncbi:DIP1984 family protein [Geoalkalibacter halelectricus]|uniref:DIP1984 family protein n=1 Tax=Geoalkalibacter halelectricus TaxID=2847045 RepID=A0ABY5ZJZ6_9BACT|nr:DIP1984 family protein [Geoalkalibacter halelectricus]MDO3377184.1 DIP1984 family protein [Geoalkalibacter halelectricus]UWZ79472.1 DIP1984 family protein [Geoalkalibacter halelectricus]
MKLAEGLIQRVDVQKRLRETEKRLERIAVAQEGDVPAEDPQDLLHQLSRLYEELNSLICRINRTNCAVEEDGTSLADMLVQRDLLQKKQATWREIAQAGTVTLARHSSREVRFVSTIPVADLQRQADGYAQNYRELDTRIQLLNWTSDLLD